jgi:hypothetical protein
MTIYAIKGTMHKVLLFIVCNIINGQNKKAEQFTRKSMLGRGGPEGDERDRERERIGSYTSGPKQNTETPGTPLEHDQAF